MLIKLLINSYFSEAYLCCKKSLLVSQLDFCLFYTHREFTTSVPSYAFVQIAGCARAAVTLHLSCSWRP